jgi:hypothetical protein
LFSENVTSPPPHSETSWDQLVHAAVAAVAASEARTNEFNTHQRGRSWFLGAPRDPARPAWTSRRIWISQTGAVLTTEAGRTACHRHRIAADKVLATAVCMARSADNTGGGVTKAIRTIAGESGLSTTAVERSRRVLRDLDLAYECARGRKLRTEEFHAARAHHGGYQSRAASTWACTSPAYAVELDAAARPRTRVRSPKVRQSIARQQRRRRDGLSPTTPVRELSPDRENSPTRARVRPTTTPKHPHPKPLHLQRAAADIAANCVGLGAGHVGRLCSVIDRAGIDTTRWTGRDIRTQLNRDSRDNGWVWPSALRSPAGFLAHRLSKLDWTGPSPSELAAARTAELHAAAERRRAEITSAKAHAASAETRRHAVANWRSYAATSPAVTA